MVCFQFSFGYTRYVLGDILMISHGSIFVIIKKLFP